MKKRLALILALVMVMSMSVTAFAGDIDQDSVSNEGTTVLTYKQEQGYTVTIPADSTVTTEESTAEISASKVVIPSRNTLKVTVSSNNYAEGWYLVDGADSNNKLAYTITGTEEIKSGDAVLSVAAGTSEEKQTLKFQVTDPATKSGTYTDTLTFTVAVEAPTP